MLGEKQSISTEVLVKYRHSGVALRPDISSRVCREGENVRAMS